MFRLEFRRFHEMTKSFKIIVEKHTDGYVAYPLGLKGVVVGEGDTCVEALSDVKSAVGFHIETFGPWGSTRGSDQANMPEL